MKILKTFALTFAFETCIMAFARISPAEKYKPESISEAVTE